MIQNNWGRNFIISMSFNDFAEKHFEGNEENAIECLVRELKEEFNLINGHSEWFKLIASLSDEQSLKYKAFMKKYKSEHKKLLNKADILATFKDDIKKRNGLSIFFGIVTALSLLYIPILFVLLIADIPFIVWVIKLNKIITALKNNDFFIVKSACSYKSVNKKRDSENIEYEKYSVYFSGYEEYKVGKNEYEGFEYGDEYFLVVTNAHPKEIVRVFNSNDYELSNTFSLLGERYIPVK